MIGLILDGDPDCEHYRCGCMVQRWPYRDGKRRVRATICSPECAERLYAVVGPDCSVDPTTSSMIYDDATPAYALPIDAEVLRRSDRRRIPEFRL